MAFQNKQNGTRLSGYRSRGFFLVKLNFRTIDGTSDHADSVYGASETNQIGNSLCELIKVEVEVSLIIDICSYNLHNV